MHTCTHTPLNPVAGTPCSGNVFITSGRSGRISNPSPFNALYGNDATCLWAVDLSGAGSYDVATLN